MAGKTDKKKQPGFINTEAPPGKLRVFIADLPQKNIVRAGRLLGMLVRIFDRRHRRIIRRNLKFIYPEWSRQDIRQFSRRVYKNVGITFLEICQMTCFSREKILQKVRIRGDKHLISAMKNHKGAIIISAHIGNWEMANLFCSAYLNSPLVVVARQVSPKILNNWIISLRSRFGNIILDKKKALPKMVRALRQGKILGLLIDQGTKFSEGQEVNFFGRKVTATPAAALLARRYQCPVLPAFCIREPDNTLTMWVEPPLKLKKTDNLPADLKDNTQIMISAIEKTVKTYPDQWFWFHKRWKRHYPQLYPEDLARKQRRKEKKMRKLNRRVSGNSFAARPDDNFVGKTASPKDNINDI